MGNLSSQRVEELFGACLWADADLTDEQKKAIDNGIAPEESVIVEGIMNRAGFSPERLQSHRAEIVELLSELPTEFFTAALGGGGGWSFLNLCMDKDGVQWTSFHRTQDMLIQLGIAIGAANYMLERSAWSMFPGGMPYVVITEKS